MIKSGENSYKKYRDVQIDTSNINKTLLEIEELDNGTYKVADTEHNKKFFPELLGCVIVTDTPCISK